VDGGGYSKKAYWRHPFLKGTRTLSWEEGLGELRDATGRPGPAGWEAGSYKEGQEDLPVSGVSWYEAASYAEFAGKQLPTISHWYRAADPRSALFVVPASNLEGGALARVGQFKGI